MKMIFYFVGGLLSLFLLIFVFELFGLGMFSFFEPKKENIRREIYENTKSYTHGKIQDLAKYYMEYKKADMQGREVLSNVIRSQFANFDVEKIDNITLKNFLIKVRGY